MWSMAKHREIFCCLLNTLSCFSLGNTFELGSFLLLSHFEDYDSIALFAFSFYDECLEQCLAHSWYVYN